MHVFAVRTGTASVTLCAHDAADAADWCQHIRGVVVKLTCGGPSGPRPTMLESDGVGPPETFEADVSFSSPLRCTSFKGSVCMKRFFPCHAVPLQEVLELSRMQTFEALQPRPWRQGVDGPLCFVSHQWTAADEPDHTGKQLHVLKEALHNLHEVIRPMPSDTRPPPVCPDDVPRLWVWLDYWSVPQADPTSQLLAIESIPAYAAMAAFMLVLCPPVTHAQTEERCDFDSWTTRGWCRLEKLAFFMSDFTVAHAPRIFALHEVGIAAQVVGSTNAFLRSYDSVFTGRFSVATDRDKLVSVVGYMLEQTISTLRERGDHASWRKLRAFERCLFYGCPSRTVEKRVPLDGFLARYGFTSPTEHAELGMTALHYAAYEDNEHAVRALVAAGAVIDARDEDEYPHGAGCTPLFYAACNDALAAVAALLELRANVHATTLSAPPLLVCLSRYTNMKHLGQLIRLLVSAGADPSEQGWASSRIPYSNSAPIHMAILYSNSQALASLIAVGADTTARCPCLDSDFDGMSPLEMAHARGQEDMVRLLESASDWRTNYSLARARFSRALGAVSQAALDELATAYGVRDGNRDRLVECAFSAGSHASLKVDDTDDDLGDHADDDSADAPPAQSATV